MAEKKISELKVPGSSDIYAIDAKYVEGKTPQSAVNTYAPTKTGGGASGTWGINISGNASNALLKEDILQLYPSKLSAFNSPLPKYVYHDIIGFCNRGVPEYQRQRATDKKWVTFSCNKELFAYKDGYRSTILDNEYSSAVWEWHNDSFAYSSIRWLVIGVTYNSPQPAFRVILQSSKDGTTWFESHSSTITSNSTPIWLSLKGRPEPVHFLRLIIEKVNSSNKGNVSFSTIRLLSDRWGDQGGGSEFEYPYSWDGDKNVTFPSKLTVNDTLEAKKILVQNKAVSLEGHSHDDRYYTESEVDSKLAKKSDSGHTHSYLPLSGGTLTGKVKVNAPIFGYNYKNSSNAAAFIFDKPGNNYTGIGAGGVSDTIHFGPCDEDGNWLDSPKQNWKFYGSIYQDDTRVSVEGHTHDDRYYTESEINSKLNGKSNTGHTHDDRYYTESEINSKFANLNASNLKSGTIPIERLPQGALERLVQVKDKTARFALTTSSVQLGDTVKQLDTGLMYIVVDTSKLNSEAGYTEYTAGSASSVPWSGVTGKPSTFTPSSHTHPYLPLSGGTLTGNLTGQYLTGTWLRTTAATDLGSAATKIAVLRSSDGYVYYRTPSEIRSDIGAASASHSHSYLPLSGGTLTGTLKIPAGSGKGLKIGDSLLTSCSGPELVLQGSHLRFGGPSWDYNQWAGLKYDHDKKTIFLGIADGTIFHANSAQSNGKLELPGIVSIKCGSQMVVLANDSRLSNSRPASDVYAWAKASAKPKYTYSEVGAAPASHSHNYLPLSGGTLTGKLIIKGDATSQPFQVRNVIGSDGNGGPMDLYLQYGNAHVIYLGSGAKYHISADGSYYSGKSATAGTADKATKATSADKALKLDYVSNASSNSDRHVWFSYEGVGNEGRMVQNDKFQYNPATDTLKVGRVSSDVSGNVLEVDYNKIKYGIICNHANGNISIRATGGGLYLGYSNTTNIFCRGDYTNIDSGNYKTFITPNNIKAMAIGSVIDGGTW